MYDPTKPYKRRILKEIESTWRSPYVSIQRDIYPILRKKFQYPEVQHTDGIGTKGIYHWKNRTFKNAVVDALAMNLNDLALIGAIPYALQNHITFPKDDHQAITQVVSSLARECRKRKIAMTGGETSIHSDMHGMDISITVSGFIKNSRVNSCKAGDILIGIKSNGIHSNGITLVRSVLGNRFLKECTKPTKIYLDTVLEMLTKYEVHGMMHITGGAYSKLKDILENTDAEIEFPKRFTVQNIFREIFDRGISSVQMYRTLNCGIGFILSVPERDAKRILSSVTDTYRIGRVVTGTEMVRITSFFDGKRISL